jgi:drug/metabolite transporter (DMT)-like permease
MKIFLIWLLLCIIWGTTWIFIKLGLNDLPPAGFAALRFTIACLILLLVIGFKKIALHPCWKIRSLIVFTGILQFSFNYGLLFWGEKYITSGLAAVLQSTIPVFGMILARIFVGETINGLKIISVLLGVIGVMLIFREQLHLSGTMAFWGSSAVVIGAFGAALASVLVKAKMKTVEPANLVFWQMLIGHLPLWFISLTFENSPTSFRWTLNAVICVLYLAIMGSVLAFWLYYWLLRKIEVIKAMTIALVTPVIAIFVGSFFGEEIKAQAIWGSLMVLLSVSLLIFQPILFAKKTEAR